MSARVELPDARTLIATRLGLDFPERRRADLERGVAAAARAAGSPDARRFLDGLATLPTESREWQRLTTELTVSETCFFRDRATHTALSREVLPRLIADRREQGNRRLRVWSAACASGQEPYSLAMLLDQLLPDRAEWALTILATDVDQQALQDARRAIYPAWSLRETSERERVRYFRPIGARFAVLPRIRDMVDFAPLNLVGDRYPTPRVGAMDLILCRNVLMYFTESARAEAVGRLQRCLAEGGWLAVGPAETSLEVLRPLVPVAFDGSVLHRRREPAKATPRVVVPAPPAPRPPSRSREQAALLRRAGFAADEGRLDEAVALCDAVLRGDRLHVEAHLLAAAVHRERGAFDAALSACRSAVYLAPDSVAAHFLHGSVLSSGGASEDARRSMAIVASLLRGVPREEPVPASDGMTAGRVLETARRYLEASP